MIEGLGKLIEKDREYNNSRYLGKREGNPMYERRNGFRHVHMGLQGNPKKTKDSKFFFALITLKNDNFFPTQTHNLIQSIIDFRSFWSSKLTLVFTRFRPPCLNLNPKTPPPSPPLPGAAPAAQSFWREVERPLF